MGTLPLSINKRCRSKLVNKKITIFLTRATEYIRIAIKGIAMKKISGAFLLRKSQGEKKIPVIKIEDFPARFIYSGKTYEINTTKRGKLIMTAVKDSTPL